MSINPEKDNIELENTEQELAQEPAEKSTIFAAPTVKEDKAKKANKKRTILISAVIAVVLAAAITAVALFVPTLNDDTSSTKDTGISLVNYNTDDVEKVSVKNPNGEFSYYSKVENTELDGQSMRYVYWHISSVAERLADSDKVQALVFDATALKAVRKMGENNGAYGLENPRYTIEVAPRDNAFTGYTIYVGNQSPDKNGAYVMLSESNEVYLVDNANLEEFAKVPTDFANTKAVEAVTQNKDNAAYFENGSLASCDYMILNNPTFSSPLHIVPNDIEGSKTYVYFKIEKPVSRFADHANELLDIAVNGLVGDGVYVFNPTDADIKKYKLDNPEATLEIKIGGDLISLKASKYENEYYALIDQNKEAIYKVYYNSLLFAENSMSHYFNKFLTMEMLANLSNITISIPNATYSFDITYYEALEDGQDFDIMFNGSELNQTAFQNYYQVFLGLDVLDYSTHQIKSDAAYTFKMKHHDKKIPDTELKLYKHTDQRYIATVNGEQMGLVSSTAYNKLTSYLEKLVNGEEVPKS